PKTQVEASNVEGECGSRRSMIPSFADKPLPLISIICRSRFLPVKIFTSLGLPCSLCSLIPVGGNMAIKVGINGFGRIGRNVLRASLNDPNIEFVAVNDLTDPKTLAHLLKYDSILGNLKQKISSTADSIKFEDRTIRVFAEKDPAKLPWELVGAQGVIESTGRFTDGTDANKDLRRARAAAVSMIPTSTGAAKALHLVIPELKGKLDGFSMRVPTPNVSVVDMVVFVEKKTSAEEVNAVMRKASESGPLKGYLG